MFLSSGNFYDIEDMKLYIHTVPKLNFPVCSISHNLIGGKQGVIDITTGPTPVISKGKSGHLVVVS